MKNETIIVGIIALYKPTNGELANIKKYISKLDYCYLIDDSVEDNGQLFLDLIAEYPQKIEYVMNEKNIGLCASVNRGFRLAADKKADWTLVMNPDGTFANDALDIYRNYIKGSECSNIAIIAPVFNIDRRPKKAGLGAKEIAYADMTGCLYNVNILKKLGFYDQNTYFYGLDTEYCMRVISKGYKIIECSEAVLNHSPAETRELCIFGKRILAYGFDKPLRFYYQFRSSWYIHKKYGFSINDLFMIYKMMKVVFFFENKAKYFKMIRKGIKDAQNGYYGKYID